MVYMVLVVPSYVPLERLAAAQGLQMVSYGTFIAIGGPMLGKNYILFFYVLLKLNKF